MTVMLAHYDIICDALHQLAMRCDGAEAQDGTGFNKPDSYTGKSLADQIAHGYVLSESDQRQAILMLQKYRDQLLAYGVDLPKPEHYIYRKPAASELKPSYTSTSAPATKKIAATPATIIDYNAGQLVLTFPYNADIVAKIKALPYEQRKWDAMNKVWRVNKELLANVLLILPGATLTPAAEGIKLSVSSAPVTVVTAPKKPASIKLIDGALVISFEYERSLVDNIKALPERKFNPPDKTWTVPIRLINELLAFMPADTEIDPDLDRFVAQQKELANRANAEDSTFDVKLATGQLMPFQRAGVEFVELAGGNAIIGDDCGLGKTIQAIGWLQHHPELRPAIIVCPSSVKKNWENEINKFMIDNKVTHVISGRKNYKLDNADIFIINYDLLSAWEESLIKLHAQVIIFDEFHRCKERTSGRSKSAKAISLHVPHKIGLTGTPLLNRTSELWHQLNIIAPQAWPKFHPYALRYCAAKQTRWGWDTSGSSNIAELHEKTKSLIVRRKKDQVLKDLPERRMVRVNIEMSKELRAEYEAALTEAEQEIQRKGKGAEALAMIEKAKQITLKAKLPAILEWIEDFISGDNKLVAFASHREATETIFEDFKDRAVKIIGGMGDQDRQDAKERFQTDDKIKLFVGNHQAAGEGITLTSASSLLFAELPWTPGLYRQCRDRIYRIGQKNACTIYNFVCTNTIDEDMINLLEKKVEIIDRTVDGQVSPDIGGSIVDELMSMLIG